MANYATLKAAVLAVVKTNGNQEITGANMQSTLLSIINSVGAGYQFMGVATTSTSPGTPDYNVYYIGGAGTYANFGTSVTVPVGSIGVFKYNGSWTNEIFSDGLINKVNELRNDVGEKVQNGTERHDFQVSEWTERKYVRADDGRIQDVNGVSASSAVDVSDYVGNIMYFSIIAVTGSAGVYGMAFYDANSNYISGVMPIYEHSTTEMVSTSTEIPSNAVTARFSCLTGSENSFFAYVNIPAYIYINGLGKDVTELQQDTEAIEENMQNIQGLKISTSIIDLVVSDDANNDILKIKNGNIITKHFNSTNQPNVVDSISDYEIADNDNNILLRLYNGHIRTKNFNSENVSDNPLFGKKIVWYGTSIPAAGYPQVCGEYLGAEVHNEAVGSSSCRMGYSTAVTPGGPLGDPYGITGMNWNVFGLSLSMKQEEKYDVCINWTTARRRANLISQGYTEEQVANVVGWGELLTNNPPADIMDSEYDVYRKLWYGCSYNTPETPVEPSLGVIYGKVDKYLNQQDFPDLWVFDHGHNDAQNSDLMKTIPTPDDDRTYFIGAMNYIIKHILSYNPRARFIFIGHYENDDAFGWNHSILCQAQEVLANYWDAPLYKAWEMYGLSRNVVITTNAYWDVDGVWHESGFDGTNGYQGYHYDGVPENIRQINGVWVHDMSLIWAHMLDGLHPFQEKIKDFIAHSIAKYLQSLIVNF